MNLRELGEDELLRRIFPRLPSNRRVISGAGDDCAVVEFSNSEELLVLKTDCVVEGIHFTREARAREVGWKAMARPLSDFAAVSGRPQFALVTLMAPAITPARWVTDLYRGLEKAARGFGVAIVGGETSRTNGPRAISVSLTGCVEKNRWRSRSGGRVGDAVFVTGRLGGSIRGKHLRFIPRITESRWLTANFEIHAMMDLSDGLGADLPRLARASGSGFEIDQRALPLNRNCDLAPAVGDGEDYELLFALSSTDCKKLECRWQKKFPRLPLTRIGELTEPRTLKPETLPSGYVHFR